MTDDNTPETADAQDRLIDAVAAAQHAQWMEWAQSLMDDEDLSAERVDRWEGLMVPYDELAEQMKEHDRKWARLVLQELDDAGALVDDLSEAMAAAERALDETDPVEESREDSEYICTCDEPDVVRTTAKGTPAAREFCSCGGIVPEE